MPERKPSDRRESFRLPEELYYALVSYVDNTRPETKKTAVVQLAVEEFLGRRLLEAAEGERDHAMNRDHFHRELQRLLDFFGVGYVTDQLAVFVDAHWPTMAGDPDTEWWAEEFRQRLLGNRSTP